MNRRRLLQYYGSGLLITMAGCDGRETAGEIEPELALFPEVTETAGGWELTVRVRNDNDFDTSIHNITVIGFNETGKEVCRTQAGDLVKLETPDRTVTTNCEQFPAIISATADESPCDGARIEILYWIGTAEQRREDLQGDVNVWGVTDRKCNEPLPPQRVIEKVATSDSTISPG